MIEMWKKERGVAVTLGLCLSILLVSGAPHQTSTTIDCDSGHPADVIFLLDASNSIWRPDFSRQIAFIRELSRMFRIGPEHTQIAVLTYAEYPQFQFLLNYYSAKSDILAAIDSIRQMGGYHTSTPEALRTMRERGFSHASGARVNVTRVAIVISDGNSDDREKTVAEAEKVKAAGIHLFAVGVGMEVDLSELEAIASPPSKYYTFTVDSYSGLDNIKELLAIKACTVTDAPTTPAPTTTPTTSTTTTVATTRTTTATTIVTTVVPSTENPLSRRTPELEGPRSTSAVVEEYEVHPSQIRVEAVAEFLIPLEGKPGSTKEEDLENVPDVSRPSKQSRGSSSSSNSDTEEEEPTRNGGDAGKHIHRSGQHGSTEEEMTPDGKGRRGKDLGQRGIDGTPGARNGSEVRGHGNGSKHGKPKKSQKWSDSRQDGSWFRDKDGRAIWIGIKDVVPVNETHIPYSDADTDYEVDQVDPGVPDPTKGSSKNGHNKRKPSDSRSRKDGSGNGKVNKKPDDNGISKHTNGNGEDEACRPKTPLDVVFIIDPKTRDRRHRRHLLETVRSTVDHIDMDNGQMRVQFVQSCPNAARERHQSLNNRVPSLRHAHDHAAAPPLRSTAELVHAMTDKLTTNGQPGRKRVGVYLTTGPSGDFEETMEAVQEAKNLHDVEMFSVGIGKDLNPVELRAISSCDANKHTFTAKNNSKTKELARQLTKSLCSVR